MNRSKSSKKVYRRTPTGRVSEQFGHKRRSPARCGLCGTILGGMGPQARAAKSERAPSRAFGGSLCGACVARLVKAKARIRSGAARPEDYPHAERELMRKAKII